MKALQRRTVKPAPWRHCVFPVLLAATSLTSVATAQNPFPDPLVKGNITIELQPIATGLTAPHYLTNPVNDPNRLFVVDQVGSILLLKNETLQPTPYFTVPNVRTLNPGYDERGFLGLAFHPQFHSVGTPGYGKFYTNSSEVFSGVADFNYARNPGDPVNPNHHGVVREWTVDPTLDAITTPSASRELIRVEQPQGNHNGGALNFGPDGYLYIGYGDGGGANDNHAVGHGPNGNGANLETILGSVVRINPLGNNSANGQYGIPNDNPYVGSAGLDEIYVSGLRNPFQFSFDVDPATGLANATATGRFILPDVGQNNIEEVNIAQLGDDLGWRYKEGSYFFDPATGAVSETPFPSIMLPSGFSPVDPVLQYDHSEGASIAGGYIYRGSDIPELDGKYVFGDWGNFSGPSGRLFYGDLDSGEIKELIIGFDDRALGLYTKGFGRGPDGELYLIAGSSLGPTGTGSSIFKIVAVPEPSSLAVLAMLSTTAVLRRRSRR